MTIGGRVWFEAVEKIGTMNLWRDPQKYIPELGLLIIQAINDLDDRWYTEWKEVDER